MSRANFNLRGRELSADFEHTSIPTRFALGARIKDLRVEDIEEDFEIYDVFDAITGEKVECTEEIRRLVMELFLQELKEGDKLAEQWQAEQRE